MAMLWLKRLLSHSYLYGYEIAPMTPHPTVCDAHAHALMTVTFVLRMRVQMLYMRCMHVCQSNKNRFHA